MEGRIVVKLCGGKDIFYYPGLTVEEVLDTLQKRRGLRGYLVDRYENELVDRNVLEAGDYTFVPAAFQGSRIAEFLNRQLPRFEFHFGPRYHPRSKDDPAPLVVLAWNGVDTQINDFVDSLDARPRLSQDSIQVNLPYRASEADLASQMQSMIAVIGRNFFDEDSGFSACFERIVSSSIL